MFRHRDEITMKLGSELLGNQDKKRNILDYIISTTREKKVCHIFSKNDKQFPGTTFTQAVVTRGTAQGLGAA